MAGKKREDGRNAATVASNKYNDKAYDRINLIVKKGKKEKIKAAADRRGLSVNGYINELLKADIPDFDRDGPDRDGIKAVNTAKNLDFLGVLW